MKVCTNCWVKKEHEEFGKDKQKCDGLNQYCKICIRQRSSDQRRDGSSTAKEYSIQYRKKNREKLRRESSDRFRENRDLFLERGRQSYAKNRLEIAKKRAKKRRSSQEREKNRLRQAEWRNKYKNKVSATVTKWKKDNPEKHGAHALVLWAVKTGYIKRSECCEECGHICKTEGHHEDYSKPMDVIWLCKFCHSKKHQMYR